IPEPEGEDKERAPTLPGVERFGGPDPFGYRFVDSDEPDGPPFLWETSTSSYVVPFLDGDDEMSGPVPIGFTFPFDEGRFDTVYVCSNGYLTFTSDICSPFNLAPPTPPPDAAADLIAPWWDDLDPKGVHRVTVRRGEGSFTVQFTAVPRYYTDAPVTFQVTLYETGEIQFRYLDMSQETP